MTAIMLGGAMISLVLHVFALVFLHGPWRAAAALSVGAMLLAVAVGILGGLAGANMAPMWTVIALPLCTAWILLLWLSRGAAALLGNGGSSPIPPDHAKDRRAAARWLAGLIAGLVR